MSYAVALEYTDSNPVMKVPPPQLPDTERIAPTVAETAAIMLSAEIGHEPGGDELPPRRHGSRFLWGTVVRPTRPRRP